MTFSLLVGLKNNLEYTRFFYEQTRQQFPDLELVFVSYGSTDGTHAWLDALQDPFVRYHYEAEERTLSDAYNTAAELATAEYVVFAHNDMVLAAGFTDYLATLQTPERIVSYSRVEPPIFADDEQPGKYIRDFGSDVATFQREAFIRFASDEIERHSQEKRAAVAVGRASFFLSISRQVLLDVGGLDPLYDPMFCEDDDLLLRLRLKGLELMISSCAICYHFVSKTSRFSDEYRQRTQQIETRSNRNFVRKWGFRIQSPVQKSYDVGLVLPGATLEQIREAEPWCRTIYTDLDVTPYLREEQPHTGFDLRAKFKPLAVEKTNGILLTPTALDVDLAVLASIPERLAAGVPVGPPRNWMARLLNRVPPMKWNGFRVQLNDPSSHETERIRRNPAETDAGRARKLRISYGLTVCNEVTELERLLTFLFAHVDPHDELLVVQDVTEEDSHVTSLLDRYRDRLVVRQEKLNVDFASFKNNLLGMASGQYLFQIDADEVPTETLLQQLKKTLVAYRTADCFAVPRVNRVEGITPELIQQWNWNVDAAGRINFPDYQLRLFRLKRGIHWKYRVHEELTGFRQVQYLPATDEAFCLLHPKEVARQQRQNALYESFEKPVPAATARPTKRIAFIVQRYGAEVNGGAEYHCRLVAERLTDTYEVDVLTSCALEYVTWANHYPAGDSELNGVRVRRFSTPHDRQEGAFALTTRELTEWARASEAPTAAQSKPPTGKSRRYERWWVEAQGPYLPRLMEYLKQEHRQYEALIFFTYLYYPTIEGLKIAPAKSILIPTAHDEPTIYLPVFRNLFSRPKALLYNSPSEKRFVNQRFHNASIYSDIVGVGIETPDDVTTKAAEYVPRIAPEYLLYLGRIDPSKGCDELFAHFIAYKNSVADSPLKLVLVGQAFMPIPEHPDVLPVGFVDESTKIALLQGARALVVPSRFESLSMVTLESFSYGVPVIANAQAEVLRDHVEASGAGFLYGDYAAFKQAVERVRTEDLRRLTDGARTYVRQHYTWERVLAKIRKAVDYVAGRPVAH
jgi:glycosyltransferase involved in cell wall biosynthesis/GT2 family glycosyltransferase